MATYRILTAQKKVGETSEVITQLLEDAYPEWRVENLHEVNGEWEARLVQDRISKSKRDVVAGDAPPWLKKKKDDAPASDGSDDDDESHSEDADEDKSDDDSDDSDDSESADDSDDSDDSDGGGKKEKGKDPVKEVQRIMDELTNLLTDLGGKTQEMQDAHDDKAQKLKDISDTVGPDGAGPGGDDPSKIGPTPGGPQIPSVPHLPGVPTGDAPVPGAPSTFAKRTEIAYHSGVDHEGKKISLAAARQELETDPMLSRDFQLVDIRQTNDGRFVAKLERR